MISEVTEVTGDTHSIIDTDWLKSEGFLDSQTIDLTDDPTQKGVDLNRGSPALPHYLALRTQSTSWGRLYAALFSVA